MNQAAQLYWDEYWGKQEKPQSVSAWQFGGTPDYLVQLVVDGIKTATCSGHIFYELENEPLPAINDYSVVLDSEDNPTALIKTVEVTIVPMNGVTVEFAMDEGDRSYRYWWNAHENFFREELSAFGREFSEDMLLVCERFELIDVKNRKLLES